MIVGCLLMCVPSLWTLFHLVYIRLLFNAVILGIMFKFLSFTWNVLANPKIDSKGFIGPFDMKRNFICGNKSSAFGRINLLVRG